MTRLPLCLTAPMPTVWTETRYVEIIIGSRSKLKFPNVHCMRTWMTRDLFNYLVDRGLLAVVLQERNYRP